MTSHPDQVDRGIALKDRLWPLNTVNAHIGENLKLQNLCDVIMISLDCAQIGKLISFDSFRRADPVSSMYEALLQLTVRALMHSRKTYFAQKSTGDKTSEVFPLSVYLEVVAESDEKRAARQAASDYIDSDGKAHVSMRFEVHSDVMGVSDDEMAQLKEAQSGAIDPELTSFMAQVAGREIVEYRIWLMNTDSNIKFSTSFNYMLNKSFEMHERRVAAETLDTDNREMKKQKAALLAAGESRSSVIRASSFASDTERWTTWETIESFLTFLSIYSNESRFNDPIVRAHCMSATKPLSNKENPACPQNVFSAPVYFSKPHPDVYQPQSLLSNYFETLPDSSMIWKFPLNTCVVPVQTHKLEVGAFCWSYTPDHQARNVQPRLSRKYFPPLGAQQKAGTAAGAGVAPTPRLHNGIDVAAARLDKSAADIDTDDEGDLVASLVDGIGALDLGSRAANERAARDLMATSYRQLGVKNSNDVAFFRDASGNAPVVGTVVTDRRQRAAEFDHGDIASRKQSRLVSDMANGSTSNASVLDAKMQHHKRLCGAARRRLTNDTQRSLQYTRDQEAAFKDYIDECTQSSSGVSSVGMAINRWMEACIGEGTFCFRSKPVIVDDSLSTFATMISTMLLDYHSIGAVFAAHREMLVLDIASLDTYCKRYALHINPLLLGEAAVSKSFLVILLMKLSIDGTRRMLTGQTAAARNVDTNRDDEMVLYQEMDRSLLCEAGDAKSAAPEKNKLHDQFKERLGTCMVTYEVFQTRPDGGRDSVTIKSSQIGNLAGCSNVLKRMIAPPVMSRMWPLQMLLMRVGPGGHNMAEKDAAARAAAEADRMIAADSTMVHDYRMFQCLHYHVENLVYIGALTDVSLPIFNLYMPIFRKVLDTEYGIEVPVRTMNRLEFFARVLVIREALVRLFLQPTSPYYGKQINIAHLKAIDPWLKDHQEMIFWLIEFAQDQYIDPHETIVNEEMLKFFSADWFTKDCRAFETEDYAATTSAQARDAIVAARALATHNASVAPLEPTGADAKKAAERKKAANTKKNDTAARLGQIVNDTNIARQQQAAAQTHGVALPEKSAADGAATQDEAPKEQLPPPPPQQKLTPGGMPIIEGAVDGHYDWNYVCFPGNLQAFAAQLSGFMKRRTRPLSMQQVLDVLETLKTRMIASAKYKQNVNYGRTNSGDPTDAFPVVVDPADKDAADRRIPVLKVIYDHHKRFVFVASAFLFMLHSNPAKAIIDRCICHRTTERRIITGAAYKPEAPHLFAMRDIAPNLRHVITVTNHTALDVRTLKWTVGGSFYAEAAKMQRIKQRYGRDFPPWQEKEAFTIGVDPDAYAAMKRLADIDLPWRNSMLCARYTPQLCDGLWRAQNEHVDKADRATYPEDTYNDLSKTDCAKTISETIAKANYRDFESMKELEGVVVTANLIDPRFDANVARPKKRDLDLYELAQQRNDERSAKIARRDRAVKEVEEALRREAEEEAKQQQQQSLPVPRDRPIVPQTAMFVDPVTTSTKIDDDRAHDFDGEDVMADYWNDDDNTTSSTAAAMHSRAAAEAAEAELMAGFV